MDIVKKNLLSIICGVVALLAIVAIFYPISGLFADLQAKVDDSAGQYKKLETVKNKTRLQPILDPRKTEAEKLGMFPNPAAIKQGQEAVKKRAATSAEILNVALAINRKPVLVPGSLPQPNPAQTAFDFRQLYRQVMSADGDSLQSEPARLMKAGLPPTPEEIATISARTRAATEGELLTYTEGQPNNAEQVEAIVLKKLEGLTTSKQLERARTVMVYAEREALAPQPQITGSGAPPDATAIFDAQTMLWAQDEVAGAIKDINAASGATSVLDAPVKHLLALGVPTSFLGGDAAQGGQFRNPAAAPATPGAAPAKLPVDASADIKPVYAASPTGRPAHTPLYDLVRFPVVLRVDATKASQVLNGLMRNRLLTVTNVDVVPFDAASARNNGYVYGDAPVIELHLDVEMLFLREWLAPLMPDAVRDQVAAMEGEAGGAPTVQQTPGRGVDPRGGRGAPFDSRSMQY